MIPAKVCGSVVATARADGIEGARYLLVKPCDLRGVEGRDGIVALDPLGVAPGEVVMLSQGSSSRQTEISRDKPVDAIIVGIIDTIEENGKVVFRK